MKLLSMVLTTASLLVTVAGCTTADTTAASDQYPTFRRPATSCPDGSVSTAVGCASAQSTPKASEPMVQSGHAAKY